MYWVMYLRSEGVEEAEASLKEELKDPFVPFHETSILIHQIPIETQTHPHLISQIDPLWE